MEPARLVAGSFGSETLTAALRAVLHDPTRHADLRRRGLERTRALTWSAMAQRSLDVLWSVATAR